MYSWNSKLYFYNKNMTVNKNDFFGQESIIFYVF